MIKLRQGRLLVLAALPLAAGCGDLSEILVDAAKESAKSAIEERVDAFIDEWTDELLDEFDLPAVTDEEAPEE